MRSATVPSPDACAYPAVGCHPRDGGDRGRSSLRAAVATVVARARTADAAPPIARTARLAPVKARLAPGRVPDTMSSRRAPRRPSTARNLGELVADDARMTWHVAFGFALLVDARGRISGAWRYGLRGVVPVRVYVA